MSKDRYMTEIGIRRRRLRAAYVAVLVAGPLFIIAAAVFAVLLYLPVFRVQEVELKDIGYLSEDRVLTLVRGRVPQRSLFKHMLGRRNILVWPDRLSADDLKLLPEAHEVIIEKDLRARKITVRVRLRERRGIICFRKEEPANCVWFDEDGVVFGHAPRTEGSLILVLNDYARTGAAGAVLEERLLQNLFLVFETLKSLPVNPKEIRLEDLALEEVRVPTHDGPALLMSLRFPPSNVPDAFAALSGKTDISALEYMDFRVENRVYYK